MTRFFQLRIGRGRLTRTAMLLPYHHVQTCGVRASTKNAVRRFSRDRWPQWDIIDILEIPQSGGIPDCHHLPEPDDYFLAP